MAFVDGVFIRRFWAQLVAEICAVPKAEKIFVALVGVGGLIFGAVTSGDTGELNKIIISGSFAIAMVLCIFVIVYAVKTARLLWAEDVDNWSQYVPVIKEYEKPKPSKAPHIFVALAVCAVAATCLISGCLWALQVYVVPVLQAPRLTAPPPTLPQAVPNKRADPSMDKTKNIELSITPYVLVRRSQATTATGTAGVKSYGLSVILRARNLSAQPRHVRQLEITGELPVRCEHGWEAVELFRSKGRSNEYATDECAKRSPFRVLSWLSLPLDHGRVEPSGDERFIRFTVSKPQPLGSKMYVPDYKDYYGFRSDNSRPKALTTEPRLEDLIRFEKFVDGKEPSEATRPQFASEIGSGTVQFTALVDSTRQPIPIGNISVPQWTLDDSWKSENPTELFYRGVYGHPVDRGRLSGTDPAISKRHVK